MGETSEPREDFFAATRRVLGQSRLLQDLRRRRGALGISAVIAVIALLAIGAGVIYLVNRPSALNERFDKPLRTLNGASTSAGVPWRVTGGNFLSDGHAALADPALKQTLAVVKMKGNVTRVRAHLKSIATGSGIVFRYADDRDYWSVVAAGQYGTWNINETIHGSTLYVGNTGGLDLNTKDSTVEVQLDGPTIRVLINGKVHSKMVIPDLQHANGVGMIADPTDRRHTQWVTFSASV
jgi:hypothetical protein